MDWLLDVEREGVIHLSVPAAAGRTHPVGVLGVVEHPVPHSGPVFLKSKQK